jgi:hypothetical protein
VIDYLIHEKKEEAKEFAFASRLKEVCKMLFRLTDEDVYSPTGKEKHQPHLGSDKATARVGLQKMGYDVMRQAMPTIINEYTVFKEKSIWVWNTEMDMINETQNTIGIITDLRFPDEETMLRQYDSVLIEVVRPEYYSATQTPAHISETAKKHINFDYKILNDGTEEELRKKLHLLLEHIYAERWITD